MHSLLFLSHTHLPPPNVPPELWQDDQMTKEALSRFLSSPVGLEASNLGSHLRVSAPPRGSPLTGAGRRRRPPTPSCRSPGPELNPPCVGRKEIAQAEGDVNTVAGQL